MADTLTSGPQPDTLVAAIAATITAWRAQNPTAAEMPSSVRREISRAVRTDARAQQLDAQITRMQVELEILHHQKALVSLGGKPDATRDRPAYEAWARKNGALSDAALALERRIHDLPHLSATDRGRALQALEHAHTVPSAAVRVRWEVAGPTDALTARVAEKVSAIRMGIATAAARVRRFGKFWVAQQQADLIAEHRTRHGQGWLTPGQAASLAELTTAAKSFDAAAQHARMAKDTQTDLASRLDAFQAALTTTRQMGVSPDRINDALLAARTEALQAEAPQEQSLWSKVQAAARGPLTPPAAAAAGTDTFAFGTAPAADRSVPLAAAARRAR
ncbi:hypothetical protein ACWDSJ_28280 [Nocardia sp. NPDC003482]